MLPVTAEVAAWAAAIESFAQDEGFWRDRAEGAYQLTKKDFSLNRFDTLLQTMVQRVYNGQPQY